MIGVRSRNRVVTIPNSSATQAPLTASRTKRREGRQARTSCSGCGKITSITT